MTVIRHASYCVLKTTSRLVDIKLGVWSHRDLKIMEFLMALVKVYF